MIIRFFNRHLSDIVLISLMLVAMALLLGDLLWHPNHYLFATGGDGLKNYFTAAWYVRYDNWLHFTGMNYPFGEHITYTDAQPLLAYVLRGLDRIGLSMDGRVPGVMNLLMMGSLIPAAMLIRRIGQHYGLPLWLAVWVALVLAFLSPQIHRWQGHYALGYACFVPLVWWLTIRMGQAGPGRRWRLAGWLMLAVAAFGMLHLYYLLIGLVMLCAYAGVLGLARPRMIATSVRAACAGLGAFLMVYLFIHFTDPITDRTEAPFGFIYYRASLKTVFYANWTPFLKVLKPWGNFPPEQMEGLGYVGVPGILALPGLLLLGLLWVRNRRVFSAGIGSGVSGDLMIWVLGSIGVLLFSMALPFRLGLEHWLDYVSPLKQFRSPGRLVFVFYHVWTLMTAVIGYQFFLLLKQKGWIRLAWLGMLVLMGIWSIEGAMNVRRFQQTVSEPNVLAEHRFDENLKAAGYKPTDFQALLTLPFYHMGSEKLYIDKGQGSLTWGMQAAYQTGIPMLNVMMSRTSLSQTLATTSLVSRYGPEASMLAQLDERPVLLLINGQGQDARLTKREQALLDAADLVYRGPDYTLWSLLPAQFDQGKEPLTDPAMEQEGVLFSDDFESGTETGLFGRAAFLENGPWVLATVPVEISEAIPQDSNLLPLDSVIEVSLWTKAFTESSSFPDILLEWLDTADQVLWGGYIITKQSIDVQPGWVQAHRKLETMPEATQLRITAEGQWICVDGLLVRKTAAGPQ